MADCSKWIHATCKTIKNVNRKCEWNVLKNWRFMLFDKYRVYMNVVCMWNDSQLINRFIFYWVWFPFTSISLQLTEDHLAFCLLFKFIRNLLLTWTAINRPNGHVRNNVYQSHSWVMYATRLVNNMAWSQKPQYRYKWMNVSEWVDVNRSLLLSKSITPTQNCVHRFKWAHKMRIDRMAV